ncbi:MAG TPA: type VI secretion system baseplate subunit TssK [Rhodocyclaceae bacterium]
MDMAPLPDPLQWSEGMLLSPQHFQQNDIRWHQQLLRRTACLRPDYWGLLDLAFDQTALQNGLLKVDRLQGLFPDGLEAQFPDSRRETSLSYDLKSPAIAWDGAGKARFHLAVPKREEGAASLHSGIQRYQSLPPSLEKDENTGDRPVEVGRMRPILSLLADHELTEKYVTFALAEVRKTTKGGFVLTGYHPPMLRSGASGHLDKTLGIQSLLEDLLPKIRNKAKELVGDRRATDDVTVTLANPETRRQIDAARRLTAALPPLEILVESRTAHPLDLYVALAGLVGQVAGIGADPMPPLLPPYRHDDCIDGFRQAVDFVNAQLDRLRIGFESLLFERVSGTSFTRRLPDDMSVHRLMVELKPANGQSAADLQRWMEQSRIANDSLMPTLAQRRLPGASVRAVDPGVAKNLQVRPDALLFEISDQPIELDNKRQSVIRRGGTLMIQGPTEPLPPAAIVLHRARIQPGKDAGGKADG